MRNGRSAICHIQYVNLFFATNSMYVEWYSCYKEKIYRNP